MKSCSYKYWAQYPNLVFNLLDSFIIKKGQENYLETK